MKNDHEEGPVRPDTGEGRGQDVIEHEDDGGGQVEEIAHNPDRSMSTGDVRPGGGLDEPVEPPRRDDPTGLVVPGNHRENERHGPEEDYHHRP